MTAAAPSGQPNVSTCLLQNSMSSTSRIGAVRTVEAVLPSRAFPSITVTGVK